MSNSENQKLAWAITGSGHYLRESLAILQTLENVDIFLSKAAAEIRSRRLGTVFMQGSKLAESSDHGPNPGKRGLRAASPRRTSPRGFFPGLPRCAAPTWRCE